MMGMSWVELPAGKYQLRSGPSKISNCQIECQISYKDIISHAPEGEWAKIAPLRILSFDIECAGRPGVFPEASIDPVIQIANVVTTYGTPSPPPLALPTSKRYLTWVMQVRQNHSLGMCLQSTRARKLSEHKSLNMRPKNLSFSPGKTFYSKSIQTS